MCVMTYINDCQRIVRYLLPAAMKIADGTGVAYRIYVGLLSQRPQSAKDSGQIPALVFTAKIHFSHNFICRRSVWHSS